MSSPVTVGKSSKEVTFSADRRSDYSELLKDPDFNDWITNLRHGSENTANDYLRKFGLIRVRFGKEPKDFTAMTPEEARAFLIRMVEEMAKSGYKWDSKKGEYQLTGKPLRHNSILGNVTAIIAWLKHKHPTINVGKINIPETDGVYDNEVPPTQEELRNILDAATDLREKVAASFVAFSGGRIKPLGNATGTDGLKIKDFPEMTVTGGKVTFKVTPTLVIVRRSLCKRKRTDTDYLKFGYFTFLNEEGCKYLQTYLQWRISRGEPLTPESPIITDIRKLPGQHLTTDEASELIKNAIVRARLNHRAYVLRRYFANALQDAEQDQLTIKDNRTFWMGHRGNIEEEYTQNKGRFPQPKIEKLREAYRKASDKYLQTITKKQYSEDEIFDVMNQRILMGFGYTQEEINKLRQSHGGTLGKLSHDEMQKLLDQKKAATNKVKKTVAVDELDQYFADGWDLDKEAPQLSNGKVVVWKES